MFRASSQLLRTVPKFGKVYISRQSAWIHAENTLARTNTRSFCSKEPPPIKDVPPASTNAQQGTSSSSDIKQESSSSTEAQQESSAEKKTEEKEESTTEETVPESDEHIPPRPKAKPKFSYEKYENEKNWLRLREKALQTGDEKSPGATKPPDSEVTGHSTALPPVKRERVRVPGQILYPATKEDIEILSNSKRKYPNPKDCEGSVIIRIVRLSDPVTSPVGRVMRNSQFGIRGNQKWWLLAMGGFASAILCTLGIWQLDRMRWKRDLIEKRRVRLSMEKVNVTESPFPWNADNIDDLEYRVIKLRGVFDTSKLLKVGPRPQQDAEDRAVPGYLVVCPLLLEDGSSILINRGFMGMDRIKQFKEMPQWVTVSGVLEKGEIANMVDERARIKNRPQDKLFVYLIASDLAQCSEARNYDECSLAVVSALHLKYDIDGHYETAFKMRHKGDYLLFWADEHVHFNYAMQWFGMAVLTMGMTIYKFIEVVRWRW